MRSRFHLIQAGLWTLIIFVAVAAARAAQLPAPAVEPDAIPKSIFMDDVNVGKDPFFPRSTRRGPQIKDVPIMETIQDLLLKGVSGSATRRLAIINNKTFEVGEEGELKIQGQTVRVKCVEIKDKSVLIRINGSNRELFLSPR